MPRTYLLRLHPVDWLVGALLLLAVTVAASQFPAAPEQLGPLLWLHVGTLVGFLACVAVLVHWEQAPWVPLGRSVLIVTVLFTLYSTLGRLGVTAMPYLADGFLCRVDVWLFGFDPSFAIEPYLTPGRIEFYSLVYGSFIPYIYVTIALNCLGRPPLERHPFLTGWALTYSISYLGYLFVPGRGPGFLHAGQYHIMPVLEGGALYQIVLDGVDATGGLQGVFPSLHVGGSLYLCLFELQTNRLRGLVYLPLVLLIVAATLVLRFHYVIDLIVGAALAAGMVPAGQALFFAWARRRQQAGLPALPGGEGDVLPPDAEPGQTGAAPVLQAH